MLRQRKECGHLYQQHLDLGFWYNLEGKPVQLFPPSGSRTQWIIVVPGNRHSNILTDEGGEERVFRIAASHITQSD